MRLKARPADDATVRERSAVGANACTPAAVWVAAGDILRGNFPPTCVHARTSERAAPRPITPPPQQLHPRSSCTPRSRLPSDYPPTDYPARHPANARASGSRMTRVQLGQEGPAPSVHQVGAPFP